jgi:hypothetical protein
MSIVYTYFFGETTEEIKADKNTLDNKYNLLKEITTFDKSLLKSYKPPVKKKKLYKFKKKKVKKPYQIPLP